MSANAVLCRVEGALAEMRRRRAVFDTPAALFGDPAWIILLELFAGDLRGERVDVRAVAASHGLARTAAERWVTALEQHGLVRRSADRAQPGQGWADLTDRGVSLLDRWAAAG